MSPCSQASLYPRRLWLGEAAAFALGVEAVALGTLLSAPSAVRGGAALCVSPRTW